MGNGILIMTHGQQGVSLLESVTHILGEVPQNVMTLALVGTERRSEIEKHGRAAVDELRRHTGGVLILTDLFGSTQANIAEKIAADNAHVVCVHGVNLVMLLEAAALRQLPLEKLQQQVLNAGKQAIKRGN